jgi:hypothetical protein
MLTGRKRRAIARIGIPVAALAALAVAAPHAAAKAPVIEAVGANKGFAAADWSLPPGVDAQFYEVGSDPTTSVFGYYLQRNLLRFGVLNGSDTCVIDDGPPLAKGVYYIHVGGHDTAPGAPQIEFSATRRIVIPADGAGSFSCPGAGGSGGGGGGGGGAVADKDSPSCTLRYKRRQDVDRLFVRARANEDGKISASAVVRGTPKRLSFRRVSRAVKQNRFVKLRLKLARKDLRTVKRALRRGKRVRTNVLVTARDGAGNQQKRRVTISLRP